MYEAPQAPQAAPGCKSGTVVSELPLLIAELYLCRYQTSYLDLFIQHHQMHLAMVMVMAPDTAHICRRSVNPPFDIPRHVNLISSITSELSVHQKWSIVQK